MIELQVAVAKVARHGQAESGDTLEMIERPGGGFSFVLVDGQGSGRGAKVLSNSIVTRAMAQLKDGSRDGVAARAAHDYLYTYRMGQVAATLNIVSVDFQSNTLLVSRNNPAPFFVLDAQGVRTFGEPSAPIGLNPLAKPQIAEMAIKPFLYLIVFTDGLLKAGEQHGEDVEIGNFLAGWNAQAGHSAEQLCDALLNRALELDRNEPTDDMTIVVLAALPRQEDMPVRRMQVTFPLEGN
ncbi:MAG: serine/threonine-protein phosphatase [Roseiflexaceae bacterium]|nr:serine/threonine-protein phosphatase [Roseiflexaceae bacterium]